jgi:hypothetical protein
MSLSDGAQFLEILLDAVSLSQLIKPKPATAPCL